MNLRQLIETKDFSKFEIITGDSFGRYYDDQLGNEINVALDWNYFAALNNTGRLSYVKLREWIDTDTHVGVYLHLLDGEPFMLQEQKGRKSYPSFMFVNKKEADRFIKFVLENPPDPEESKVDFIGEDYLDIEFNEFEARDISMHDLLLSPGGVSTAFLRECGKSMARCDLDMMFDYLAELEDKEKDYLKTVDPSKMEIYLRNNAERITNREKLKELAQAEHDLR